MTLRYVKTRATAEGDAALYEALAPELVGLPAVWLAVTTLRMSSRTP
jgi:hypothetical protein